MAPLLTSSAAGGVKAAPKAPPRRRPAAPPPAKAAPPPAKPADPPSKPPQTSQSTTQQVRFAKPLKANAVLPTPPPTQEVASQPSKQQPAQPASQPTTSAPSEPPTQAVLNTAPLVQDGSQAHTERSGEAAPATTTSAAPVAPMLEPDVQAGQGTNETTHSALSTGSAGDSVEVPAATAQTDPEPTPTAPATSPKRKRGEKAAAKEPAAKRRKPTKAAETVAAEGAEVSTAKPAAPRRGGRRKIQTPATVVEDDEAAAAASGETAAEEPTQDGGTASKAKQPRKPRQPRKKKTDGNTASAEGGEGASGVEGQDGPTPQPKKPRKPRQPRAQKKKTAAVIDPALADQPGEATGTPEDDTAMTAEEAAHVSDPEDHEIDPDKQSMYTITKQKRGGKTSEREKKMAAIDWDEVKRKRLAEAEQPLLNAKEKEKLRREKQKATQKKKKQKAADPDATSPLEGEGENDENQSPPDDDDQAADEEAEQDPETRAVDGGLRFRVVDGEIIADEETLTLDRQAAARAAIDAAGPQTTLEDEEDLTALGFRHRHLNERRRDPADRVPVWKAKADPWSQDETERFYEALRAWGTDFMIISRLFPPKTRMQVKKKFVREERLDPERINAALLGKSTSSEVFTGGRMGLEAYAQAADLDLAEFNKFDSLEHANEVIRESLKDKEEEMRAAVAEEEEVQKQRRVMEGQREARKKERETKREMRRAAKSRGKVMGSGTF